jgi:tripartite-type tricarboxylate transporter receptor subunit TctC
MLLPRQRLQSAPHLLSRRKIMSLVLRVIAAMLAATLSATAAQAQTYPSRPVRIVIPAAPGGINGILGRIMAERLQRSMGQPFVVEDRGGAGGLIATDAVAKSAPDGYTLLLSFGGPIAVGLGLYKTVPYDVMRDFAPISMIADVTMIMVSSPGFKPQGVKELIEYARANPGKVNAAINSPGSMGHMLTEQFRLVTKTKLTLVTYKGSGPAIIDLMAGNVDIDVDTLPATIGQIKGGRLRPLAVASANRSELLPDVPTFKELGLPGLEVSAWFALLAPAGTPKEIIERLNQEATRILQAPETKELLAKQGANARTATSQETSAFMRQEIEKWAKVVKDSGAKFE